MSRVPPLRELLAPASLDDLSSPADATRAASAGSPRRGRNAAAPPARPEEDGPPPPPPGSEAGDTDPLNEDGSHWLPIAAVVSGLAKRLALYEHISEDRAARRIAERAEHVRRNALPSLPESVSSETLKSICIVCAASWLVLRSLERRVAEVREGGDQ